MRPPAISCCLAARRTIRNFGFLRHNVRRRPQFDLSPIRRRMTHAFADQSTIYALSTAPGRAAIAIIRVSGPQCLDVYRLLCPGKKDPSPRYASVRTLFDPKQPTSVLDSDALILYFPSPRTVTGEDLLELHVHGGPAIVKAVLAAVPACSTNGRIRYAEPGEFTQRAFLNDRLDLTQVEALGDALAATTERQRELSVRGTGNGLAKRYETWRQQLLYARGEMEALIDFSEDQHFDESPSDLCSSVARQVQALRYNIAIHSQNAMRGELLRHGITISLLGAPNAGKSSLLNLVVGREAAIVSQEAGTTRDVVEVGIDLGGFFCRLGDTAGLRQARRGDASGLYKQEIISQIEQEGMRRAKQRAGESDAVVVVLSFEPQDSGGVELQLDQEVIDAASELISTRDNVTVVINKSDLCDHPDAESIAVAQTLAVLPQLGRDRIHFISCRQAQNALVLQDASMPDGNISSFLQGLIAFFSDLTAAVVPDSEKSDPSIWQESLGASERHRLLLDECHGHLGAFLTTVRHASDVCNRQAAGKGNDEHEADVDIVLAAEYLRHAADCLARITGKGAAGDVEEVLGVVFEKFCVGK